MFSKGWNGLTPTLGGLVSGSGLGGGVQWLQPGLLDGRLSLRSSARISTRAYQLYDVALGMPRLAGNDAFLDVYVRHRNDPQLAYYGPGAESAAMGTPTTGWRTHPTMFPAA
ncbi:MAG: hypothetical protein ACR2NN_01165 [Bryobacteraceae bacterium]